MPTQHVKQCSWYGSDLLVFALRMIPEVLVEPSIVPEA